MSFFCECAAAFSFIHSLDRSFIHSSSPVTASLRHNRQHINRALCSCCFFPSSVWCQRNSDPMSMLSLTAQKLSTIQTWIITICFAMIITQQIENFVYSTIIRIHTHTVNITTTAFILSYKIQRSCCHTFVMRMYPCPSWNGCYICVSTHFCATIFDKQLLG